MIFTVHYKTNRGPLKNKRISVPVEAKDLEDARKRFDRVTTIIQGVDASYMAEVITISEK